MLGELAAAGAAVMGSGMRPPRHVDHVLASCANAADSSGARRWSTST